MIGTATAYTGSTFWKRNQESAGQMFPEQIRYVTRGSNQASWQKPGIEMELPRQDLRRTLLSNTDNPMTSTRLTRFLRLLRQLKCCQPGLKETKGMKWRKNDSEGRIMDAEATENGTVILEGQKGRAVSLRAMLRS